MVYGVFFRMVLLTGSHFQISASAVPISLYQSNNFWEVRYVVGQIDNHGTVLTGALLL